MLSSLPKVDALPPAACPKRLQTFAELQELQRITGSVIFRSLTHGFQMQRKWIDGRDADEVIGEFIKPNDRLRSFERLEAYNLAGSWPLASAAFSDK